MTTRTARLEDWDRIKEICEKHYIPFPEFTHILAMPVVVDDNDKVVAFGYLREFVEVTFIPDLATSPRVIVEALKLLQYEAVVQMRLRKIDRIFAFVRDLKFAKILLKHFNYKSCDGEAYYYRED